MCDTEPHISQRRLTRSLVAVVSEHVANLMRHHCGELMLIYRNIEQSFINADLAAGQREGVHLLAREERDFPEVDVALRLGQRLDDVVGDALHIACRAGILARRRLLAHLRIGGCPAGCHLCFGVKHDLTTL